MNLWLSGSKALSYKCIYRNVQNHSEKTTIQKWKSSRELKEKKNSGRKRTSKGVRLISIHKLPKLIVGSYTMHMWKKMKGSLK